MDFNLTKDQLDFKKASIVFAERDLNSGAKNERKKENLIGRAGKNVQISVSMASPCLRNMVALVWIF